MKNVLILCTGNSARSILGEAIVSHEGAGRYRCYSAGSTPKGAPHPLALKLLASKGIETAGFSSKSWDAFAAPDAPQMDIVITVCDNAAGETCPYWPGAPVSAHWGIPDPAEGGEADFRLAWHRLMTRVSAFLTLPDDLDAATLMVHLNTIGKMPW